MSRVLVVEDDETIGLSLVSALTASGYTVRRATTGRSAIASGRNDAPELVLLDLGLPDMEGFTVCRELRAILPRTVIVLLTARTDQLDVVSGLESGADDYLTKPFRTIELLARVRAHLRRARTMSDDDSSGEPVVLGSLVLDASGRQVSVGQNPVVLRAREFDLLARFVREPGVAISRETLMSEVWDENWFGSTKTLDVHVASLRHRLRDAAEAAGDDAVLSLPEIVTLRGHGYRLDLRG